ncbi:MAG: hypothetical protein FJ011_13055 [Chloroflexi bacterium]|nr:hypothetical protein [Chloroflexota bacterium]
MGLFLDQRVANLEELMAQVLHTVDRVDRQVERLSREMREFKDEMRDFKDEMRYSSNEMNRKWGDLANKMGTMAEDLVVPSIPRILRLVVGCPPDGIQSMAVRVRRQHPTERGRSREFDVVAACGEYVLINETKSRLDPQIVRDFADHLPEDREFFPEYAGRQFIGAIASLYVDESLVRQGEKLGLIVLGFGEGVMDVLNSPGFIPKAF